VSATKHYIAQINPDELDALAMSAIFIDRNSRQLELDGKVKEEMAVCAKRLNSLYTKLITAAENQS
jgi:hypothetical protein